LKSDVFSFGLIIWTLFCWQTQEQVKSSFGEFNYTKLPVPAVAWKVYVSDLFVQCMKKDYEARPSFMEIKSMLELVQLNSQYSLSRDSGVMFTPNNFPLVNSGPFLHPARRFNRNLSMDSGFHSENSLHRSNQSISNSRLLNELVDPIDLDFI
jgi:hypothetical protein